MEIFRSLESHGNLQVIGKSWKSSGHWKNMEKSWNLNGHGKVPNGILTCFCSRIIYLNIVIGWSGTHSFPEHIRNSSSFIIFRKQLITPFSPLKLLVQLSSSIIIVIFYFENVNFFHDKLGSDVFPRVDNQTSGDTLQDLTRPLGKNRHQPVIHSWVLERVFGGRMPFHTNQFELGQRHWNLDI